MAATLELALLGHPELHLAGQPVGKLRSAKAYGLLYYLAVTRRMQPRTVLAGLFWGDGEEYYARRNFNRTLSDLTQAVGDHLLVERQAVAFARQQPHWLDVATLETAAATAPTVQNIATLVTAANLYRGEFLDGFYVQEAPEFEQWLLHERTRLRSEALRLHQTLAHFYAAQGELLPAMDHVRRMLQLEPWREEAHRQLMHLLVQSGQRSAALAQYELCRQALRSELEVEPDAVTLALVAQIRAGGFAKVTSDPVTSAPVTSAPVTSAPVTINHPVTPSPAHPVIPHNLPGQRTPFIGRAAELGDLVRLLVAEDDCRLLTLIGPGGMGKTRLALKLAEQLATTPTPPAVFADGVFFVPLENVGDADGLVAAVIAAIAEEHHFPRQRNAPLADQLFQFLGAKAMLLVLDNFEQLVKHADFCSTLLLAAPNVKLLVTSRETLGLQEAWFYPLLGLSLPTALPTLAASASADDAIRLFAQCARRARPDFRLEDEPGAVLRICQLVEGMPLGIELAAAWRKVMSCEQIAQEVTRGLDILTARYHNVPARHRSIRAVMDHSWRLLEAEESAAIARLTVFRGRFRQAAAAAITGTSLFTLATLVEKALVRVTLDGYYQLHELTRQYAAEQLAPAEQATLRDAHASYYAGLLHEEKSRLFTATYRQAWATVEGELANVHHAWAWLMDAIATGRPTLPVTTQLRQMAEVLAHYYLLQSLTFAGQTLFTTACQVAEAAGWTTDAATATGPHTPSATLVHLRLFTSQFHYERGHFRAGLDIVEALLETSRAGMVEADLLAALLLYGRIQVRRGATQVAATALQEGLALGQRLGSTHSCAEALLSLGVVASMQGHYEEAQSYLHQGLALAQTMGYRPWIARALTNLGTTYSRQYDYQQAGPYYEQALTIAQEEGDQNLVMIITSNLAGVQRGFGRHALSIEHYQRSLAMARAMGEERWIAANLNGLSITYLATGELAAATHALQEALTIGQQSDSTPDILGSISLLGHLFARRGQLEKALKALTFAEAHPTTMARDRLYNRPLLADLRSELPAPLFEQAAHWAQAQSLEQVVNWLQQA